MVEAYMASRRWFGTKDTYRFVVHKLFARHKEMLLSKGSPFAQCTCS